MEVVGFSEMLLLIYQIIRRHSQAGSNINARCKDEKSYDSFLFML